MIKKSKKKQTKTPTRRADGGKQIKTDAIIQRVRQFMINSVTKDKNKGKKKAPTNLAARGEGKVVKNGD